ncbi:MAG: MFS transporter [Elusimicrobia bacterium]|nr:MFS transporter [Elusimicrobiota bacterium]
MSGGGKGRTALRALLVCQAVLVAGLTLSFPFLTLYLHEERGLPMGLTGAAIGLTVAAAALGQGLGGELSDLVGCKRVMEGAVAGRAVFTAALAWAVWRGWPVAAVVSLSALSGFAGNFYGPAVRAWIAHEHAPGGRVRAYGLLRVATNASWAVGPAAGGLLARWSYGFMFAATAAVCAAGLALLVWAVPRAPAARAQGGWDWGALASLRRDRRFVELCALTAAIACVMGQLVAPLSAHASAHAALSDAQIGLLFTVNGALVVALQHAATRAASRWRLSAVSAAGCLFYAAGYAWVGFAGGWGGLAAGVGVVTLGEIAVSPCLPALTANLAPERERGRYLGMFGLSWTLGNAMGPLLGGYGFQWAGTRWIPAPWLAVGALALASGYGFKRLGRSLTAIEEGLEPALEAA